MTNVFIREKYDGKNSVNTVGDEPKKCLRLAVGHSPFHQMATRARVKTRHVIASLQPHVQYTRQECLL